MRPDDDVLVRRRRPIPTAKNRSRLAALAGSKRRPPGSPDDFCAYVGAATGKEFSWQYWHAAAEVRKELSI